MWTLKYIPGKVKTIKPWSQPSCIFWPHHLLLSHTWALWREGPNWDSLEVCWDPSGPPGTCAHGWWLWLKLISRRHCSLPLKPDKSGPYFIPAFSPSSLGLAVSKLSPTHSWVHEHLSPAGDKVREHQPKNTPGMVAALWVTECQPSAWSHDFIYGHTWSLDTSWVLIQQHI